MGEDKASEPPKGAGKPGVYVTQNELTFLQRILGRSQNASSFPHVPPGSGIQPNTFPTTAPNSYAGVTAAGLSSEPDQPVNIGSRSPFPSYPPVVVEDLTASAHSPTPPRTDIWATLWSQFVS